MGRCAGGDSAEMGEEGLTWYPILLGVRDGFTAPAKAWLEVLRAAAGRGGLPDAAGEGAGGDGSVLPRLARLEGEHLGRTRG